jgi:hypothetical protein
MIIAVDFDGTCVAHEFPRVGPDIGAKSVLKELMMNGHEIVLFTMRSGAHLQDAVNWFDRNRIVLSGIQYSRGQTKWTSSNKCYANLYIDDAALGIPLLESDGLDRPFVDWTKCRKLLVEMGLIPDEEF